ncbi:unnamed protein product [Strongylus vulgaris]|uniref:Uncharacterized protein n=1 Tax=Strongylus vulgaris TaxID=40348 RepID=A0A3P7IWA9_STRVU|nr:unnamed protein product [Strongylus vulgaris]
MSDTTPKEQAPSSDDNIVQAPSPDDNILIRHQHIAESIEMIRAKKDQLLRTLRGLSTSENPDKALMAKLIEAFDMMTAQENQFLGVLKSIVDIHNQATLDVAEELEGKKAEETSEKKDAEKMKEEKNENIPEKNTPEDDENDEEAIKETLKELEQVSIKALAAAQLNEKLVETLQRHKKSDKALSLDPLKHLDLPLITYSAGKLYELHLLRSHLRPTADCFNAHAAFIAIIIDLG